MLYYDTVFVATRDVWTTVGRVQVFFPLVLLVVWSIGAGSGLSFIFMNSGKDVRCLSFWGHRLQACVAVLEQNPAIATVAEKN